MNWIDYWLPLLRRLVLYGFVQYFFSHLAYISPDVIWFIKWNKPQIPIAPQISSSVPCSFQPIYEYERKRTAPLHIIVQWNLNFLLVYYTHIIVLCHIMGIDELCNILKYVIYGFFIKSTHLIINDLFYIYCLVYFYLLSTHSLKEPWLDSLLTDWAYQSVEQNAYNHNASDWQICKNKQELSDFWAISYCFLQFVMLFRIQMHFVLLTTISLLFVREGHFWIILKKGRGSLEPQSPPSARACSGVNMLLLLCHIKC